MPNSQLMPLHWGQSDRTLDVFDVDPASKVTPPIKGSGLDRRIKSGSKLKRLGGDGITKRVGGSGRTKGLRGRGRLCP